jgi:hypothetical protein
MAAEHLMILEMVDEGRITPDEALTLLSALGDASESDPISVEWFTALEGDEPDRLMSAPFIGRERVV